MESPTQRVLDEDNPDEENAASASAPMAIEVKAQASSAAGPSADPSDPACAGKKRSGSDAGLDDNTDGPDAQSTDAKGLKPKKMEEPERIMATASTIAVALKIPEGPPVTEVEVEYYVDGKKRRPDPIKVVNTDQSKVVVLIDGLNLINRVSKIRARGINMHGPCSSFSPVAYDESNDLRCSAPAASVEDLRAFIEVCEKIKTPDDLQTKAWPDLLELYLTKGSDRPQLEFLFSDLFSESLKARMSNKDAIQRIVEHCKHGSVSLDVLKQPAIERIGAKQDEVNRAKGAEDLMLSKLQQLEDEQAQKQKKVSEAEAESREAERLLKLAQKRWDEAQKIELVVTAELEVMNKARNMAKDAADNAQQATREKQLVLEHARLVSEALEQARTARSAPRVSVSTGRSAAPTPPPAFGRPPSMKPQALRNRIRQWANEDLSTKCLRDMGRELKVSGFSKKPKDELVDDMMPGKGGFERVVDALRLSEAFSQTDLNKLYGRIQMQALADRSEMVQELISWLLPRPAPGSTVPTVLPVPPPFTQQASLLDRVKKAVVRVALYDKNQGKILNVGSGVVMKSYSEAFAQVLTCAHNFLDVGGSYSFLYGRQPEAIVILIGTYMSDAEPSEWKYSAKLKTPEALLKEEVPFGSSGSKSLLDLAVLEVNRYIDVKPSAYQGLNARYTLGHEHPVFSAASICPLRWLGLERGDANKIVIGSSGEVSAAGWYSQHEETSLHVAPDYKVLSKDPSGLFISDTVLDSGGSGGPLLNRDGQVIAINSMSRQGTTYKSYARMIHKLRREHGLE